MNGILLKSFLVMFALSFLLSCGKSEEDIAKEKQRIIDSMNVVSERSRIEAERIAQERIEEEKRNQEKIEEEKRNNPLNYLGYKLLNENNGIFVKDRLVVSVQNLHPSKRIADVKIKVIAFSKTDTKLGEYEDIIYDFITPKTDYNRMIDYSNFHSEAKKYSVIFLDAKFK